MKREKFVKLLRHIEFTVLTGLFLFGIFSAVYYTGRRTFDIIGYMGIANARYRTVLWVFTLLFLFIIAGEIVDFILKYRYRKKSEKFIAAMQKLTDGEFSVRIQNNKRYTDTENIAVDSFNNMATQLQATEAMNRDFIGNFSHELKTPIGTINGFARVLKSNDLTEEEKNEYLDIIIEESERLSTLSGNILMLSRIEKQPSLSDISEYNLTEQLRQTVAAMYHKWDAKNIDIDFAGEEISISANRELMAQVWINLIDNAIKFSPENESIYINVIKYADCVSVSIKNYGCTLSDEEIFRIFDKFYQGAGEKKALGNGLGLSMVKKIIELHGGNASAMLSGNTSITITIKLPLT